MASKPFRGSHLMASNCPAPGSSPSWLRATALFGSVPRRDLPVGRTASLPDIQKLLGKLFLHCCKMSKERFGLGSGTRAGSAPSEPERRSAMEQEVSAGP